MERFTWKTDLAFTFFHLNIPSEEEKFTPQKLAFRELYVGGQIEGAELTAKVKPARAEIRIALGGSSLKVLNITGSDTAQAGTSRRWLQGLLGQGVGV